MNVHEDGPRETEHLEHIAWNGKPLAYIIRAEINPEKTMFLTPPEFKQQVGFVVYPAGGEIQRHMHCPLERHLVGTSEDDRQVVAVRELRQGDIMLMVGGGHGFRMLEDTVFLEVKQGPYTGLEEKERF